MALLKRLIRSDTGKAAVPSFAISLAARFAQLGMTVMAARVLAPEGFGAFTFALGGGLIGGRLGGLGWPTLLQRFVPRYRVDEDWAHLAGLWRAAQGIVGIATLIGAALLALLALGLGSDHKLYDGLLLGALVLPAMGFRALLRNMLAALHRPQNGILLDEMIPPVIMCAGLALLWGGGLTPAAAMLIYTGGSVLAVLAGFLWVRRHIPPETADQTPRYSLRHWMKTALPALVGMSSKLLMNKTDVLMLAPLAVLSEVGLYGAALRVTYLLTAPMTVLSTVLTARISTAIAQGKIQQAKRLLFGALGFATLYAAPVALALVLFAAPVMGWLFGADYTPGGPVLAVLALAQLGAALNMATTNFILMSGRQKAFGQMTTAALVVNLLANLALIPSFGALGAAMGTALSIWLLVAAQLWTCRGIIRSGRYSEETT
jgi:O-antigen/teichoic acid export membrane protein